MPLSFVCIADRRAINVRASSLDPGEAYSFTSVPNLSALKAAHARGVNVEVIVD